MSLTLEQIKSIVGSKEICCLNREAGMFRVIDLRVTEEGVLQMEESDAFTREDLHHYHQANFPEVKELSEVLDDFLGSLKRWFYNVEEMGLTEWWSTYEYYFPVTEEALLAIPYATNYYQALAQHIESSNPSNQFFCF